MAASGTEVDMVEQAVHWAASNGLTMMSKRDGKIEGLQHCPMTLEPFEIPQAAFEQAQSYALPFNVLVDRVSRDTEFMYHALEGVVGSDEFTANLIRISKAVNFPEGGLRQKLALGFQRSDYMLNEADGNMLQVELNTISASFGVLSDRISRLHRFLQARFGQSEGLTLPTTNVTEGLANAIATAHNLYNLNHSSGGGSGSGSGSSSATASGSSPVVVVFVVQGGETNIADQRPVEYALFEHHGVRVVRLTLAEINARTSLSADSGRLILDETDEISVVYFRAGYSPNDYHGQAEWDARERVESSLAIKCPSVDYQLVGTKKIQQVLTDPKVLARFCSPADSALLFKCMAGIWALGTEADEVAKAERAKAIEHPENYVVKPQREGGGNNFYGKDVRRVLKEMSETELSAYILMQRIFPAAADTTLVRNGAPSRGQALCELGIYAPYIGDGERTFLNTTVGHLVRTKFVGVDEGGVASGYACLSSPGLKP